MHIKSPSIPLLLKGDFITPLFGKEELEEIFIVLM
jgi:hypothetical protein